MDPRTSAQDLMRCDLCEIAKVQMSCDTCLVNLCKACMGEHFSADPSKPHQFIHFKDRKSTPLYPGCTSHDNERCEMYCNQCHIPICHTCLATNIHLGHELSKLLQILEEKKKEIAREKCELVEKIYPNYQDIVADIQNRIRQLEDLFMAITKRGEDLHREIDKIVQKLKAEVEMKTTPLLTLQNQMDEVNKKISYINDEISVMDVALDSNDMSKIFSVISVLDEYKILPQNPTASLPEFTPGRIQGEEIRTMFGTLSSIYVRSEEHGYSMKTTQKSPEDTFSPVIKQLLDKPQTVTTIPTEFKYSLFNVACLSDGEIWTRGENSFMKLYSINHRSLLQSIRTKSGYTPNDIAVTNSGDLVYTDVSDRTVNIVKKEIVRSVITLKQGWKPLNVCCTSSGDLLVTMISDDRNQSKVVRFSGSKATQTIQFDDQTRPLYSSDYSDKYISENRNLNICVADSIARAVVVVNQAGKLRFRYTGHTPFPKNKPFVPTGITTDSQSHILSSDDNNQCVHIIDQDGQFLRYIQRGLSGLMGLSIDTNDNLFIAQSRNQKVKKIKYQQ